jgi:hypothetical protein
MGPVAQFVPGISSPVQCVDPEDVIDVTVPVIVPSVAGNLSRIAPKVEGEVFVCIAHPGIDDGYGDAFGRAQVIPGCGCAQVSSADPAAPPQVVKCPEDPVGVSRVVWRHGGFGVVIRFDLLDIRLLEVAGRLLTESGCIAEFDQVEIQFGESPENPSPMPMVEPGQVPAFSGPDKETIGMGQRCF